MKCTLLLAGLLYFVSSCSQDEKVNTDPPQPKSEISEMSDEELEAYAESIGAITMDSLMSWIKAYVPELEATPQEYTDAMTLSGTKVEGFEVLDEDLDKIVVGKILKIERHPDATKLIVCQVQIDEEGTVTQIVTGAPNVKEGRYRSCCFRWWSCCL